MTDIIERLERQWAALDPVDEYRADARDAIDEIERLRAQIGGKDDLSQSLIDECERLRADLAGNQSTHLGQPDIIDLTQAKRLIAQYSGELAKLRAELDALRGQEPVATLHDDGYWTFKKGKEPNESRYAGWRMDVFAAPHPSIPDGWQPIETAPTNGEAILIANSAGVWAAKYKAVYQSGYKPESPWMSLMLNKDHIPARLRHGKPTHWMPLPAAPKPGDVE